jgi:hypothetical protein
MNLLKNGFKLVLASLFLCMSVYAGQTPGDAKEKKQKGMDQPKASMEMDFTYVVHGIPTRIDRQSDGTYVTCQGTEGRCMVLDFDNGVAIVDPDNCNMGPTFIGCQKVNGDYWKIIKQTPMLALWELYEIQQLTTMSTSSTTTIKLRKK